ncbi:DraG protein [Stutzerimonas xanthomarina]|nr:DraG protein [Stutzerimonas xanthomarina]
MTCVQAGELESLLNAVIELVEDAGDRLIREWEREGGPRGHGDKAEIDNEIEVFLRQGLLSLHEADFWGEETGQALTGDRYCWVVDPHDGTRDFLKGLRGSSISVALLRDQQPVLGVVHAPISPDRGKDCIAWAEGLPYLLRNRQAHPVDLSTAQLTDQDTLWLSAAAARKPYANIKLCAPARFVAMPSVAYRLARAAAGDGVGAVSLTELSAHDVAGAHALLIGAKGVLLNQSAEPLDYRNMELVCIRCFGGAPEVCAVLARRPWHEALNECSQQSRRLPSTPRFPRVELMRRAHACLAGLLIGDNLGAQVEFMDAREIAERCVQRPIQIEDGGVWGILAGQSTDDGELALALARSLVQTGRYDAELAATAYVQWLKSEPFDVGQTTRQALGPTRDQDLSVAEACRLHASLCSQANGALMRVAPIGIAAHGQPELAAAWARQDAQLTHPHPVCLEANAAFVAAIAVGMHGADRQHMFTAAMGVLAASEHAQRVREALLAAAAGERPSNYQKHMGWVLIALQNAFYYLMSGANAEKAIIETVMRGGDTDTNACITGALLGVADIDSSFIIQQSMRVAACRPDETKARSRPIHYWPDDVSLIAQRLLGTTSSI